VEAAIITRETARTTTTAAATMITLAAPSLGSRALSAWRVVMAADATGPAHSVDREQIWLPVSGTFEFTIDGTVRTVTAGEAATVPAGALRQVRAPQGPAEALVCMPIGGRASVPGEAEPVRLRWAD
jgi:quercetin dioxygenase-like cupin family protein